MPAIRALPRVLGYFVGSDAGSATIVNVSVWDTREHANAMSTLASVLALAVEFVALGVTFEHPIINFPYCGNFLDHASANWRCTSSRVDSTRRVTQTA